MAFCDMRGICGEILYSSIVFGKRYHLEEEGRPMFPIES